MRIFIDMLISWLISKMLLLRIFTHAFHSLDWFICRKSWKTHFKKIWKQIMPRRLDISPTHFGVRRKKHFCGNFHAAEPLCLDLWKSNRIKNLLQSASWFYREIQEGRHYFCISPSPQCPITISCWAFRCPLSPLIFRDRILKKSRCQDGVGV